MLDRPPARPAGGRSPGPGPAGRHLQHRPRAGPRLLPFTGVPATSSWASSRSGRGAGVGRQARGRRDQRRLRRLRDLPRGPAPHCERRTVLGIVARDGAFAEHLTLPVANLHEVPEEVRTRWRCSPSPPPRPSRSRSRWAFARRPGGRDGGRQAREPRGADAAARLPPPRGGTQPAAARALSARGLPTAGRTDRAPAGDVAVECTGQPGGPRSGPPRRAAARHDRPQEHYHGKARRHGPLRRRRDHPRGLALWAVRPGPEPRARRVDPRPLVEARYPLADAVAAFDHAARPGALKILVDC